jgi:hypothetical protein
MLGSPEGGLVGVGVVGLILELAPEFLAEAVPARDSNPASDPIPPLKKP